jgi:hypothetical protein
MAEVLYSDKTLTIYKELIVINKYYFPLATSKTILLKDIEFISLLNSDGVSHRWGVTSKHLNNWFPLDSERSKKTKFIEIRIKGKRMRPSITPEDPDKVFRIIWENYTEEGKKFVAEDGSRRSEKDKETELCQQEAMERQRVVEAV